MKYSNPYVAVTGQQAARNWSSSFSTAMWRHTEAFSPSSENRLTQGRRVRVCRPYSRDSIVINKCL